MKSQALSDRLIPWGMALALVLVYTPNILSYDVRSQNFIRGDCFFYRAVIDSILQDGDLILNNNLRGRDPLEGYLALGREGRVDRLVSKAPILMPLVSLPFYVLMGTYGLLVFNVVVIVSLIIILYGINRLVFERWVAVASSMLFGVGTLFYDYSYNYSPDAFSTLLLVGGVYLALLKRYNWSALGFGLAIFAKPPNVLLVGIVCLYVAAEILTVGGPSERAVVRLSRIAIFGLLLAAALAPMAITNHIQYGAPWITGYNRSISAAGVDDHVGNFNQPFALGLSRLLFDGRKGLIVTNPVLLLSALGAACIGRSPHKAPLLLLLTLCLVQLSFFARYDQWNFSHFSNRFLMTTVALSSVFAGQFLSSVAECVRRKEADGAGTPG